MEDGAPPPTHTPPHPPLHPPSSCCTLKSSGTSRRVRGESPSVETEEKKDGGGVQTEWKPSREKMEVPERGCGRSTSHLILDVGSSLPPPSRNRHFTFSFIARLTLEAATSLNPNATGTHKIRTIDVCFTRGSFLKAASADPESVSIQERVKRCSFHTK